MLGGHRLLKCGYGNPLGVTDSGKLPCLGFPLRETRRVLPGTRPWYSIPPSLAADAGSLCAAGLFPVPGSLLCTVPSSPSRACETSGMALQLPAVLLLWARLCLRPGKQRCALRLLGYPAPLFSPRGIADRATSLPICSLSWAIDSGRGGRENWAPSLPSLCLFCSCPDSSLPLGTPFDQAEGCCTNLRACDHPFFSCGCGGMERIGILTHHCIVGQRNISWEKWLH